MSSYNRVEKIKYAKDPTDVVSLDEYIVFENARAEEKCVVFKFSNNLNQQLYELRFEVLQYDPEGDLLEKSVAIYKDFVAAPNAPFVPDAKLRINFACSRIQVRLIFAAFDRVKWEDGELRDNSYRFDSYAEAAAPEPAKPKTPAAQSLPQKKEAEKIPKSGFSVRHVTHKNHAAFPKAFDIIVCLLILAFVITTAFLFRRSSEKFYSDGFDLELVSDDTVNIFGYDGGGSSVTVPAKIGDYTVSKISAGAFRKSGVREIVFETEEELVIESGAFAGCRFLRKVTASEECGSIFLMEKAFDGCTALRTVELPTARLSANSFYGSYRVEELSFARFVSLRALPLKSVFGAEEPMKFRKVNVDLGRVPYDFFSGVEVDDFASRNPAFEIETAPSGNGAV